MLIFPLKVVFQICLVAHHLYQWMFGREAYSLLVRICSIAQLLSMYIVNYFCNFVLSVILSLYYLMSPLLLCHDLCFQMVIYDFINKQVCWPVIALASLSQWKVWNPNSETCERTSCSWDESYFVPNLVWSNKSHCGKVLWFPGAGKDIH